MLLARLALTVVALLISWLLTPKPEEPKPATLDDFDVPRAQEGAYIPKVYGFVWIKAPQIAWFGHFKTRKIKKSGKK